MSHFDRVRRRVHTFFTKWWNPEYTRNDVNALAICGCLGILVGVVTANIITNGSKFWGSVGIR